MSKPKSNAQQLSENGGSQYPQPMTVLGRAPEAPPALDITEVVARFQLETEAAIAAIKRDHQAQLVGQERKIATLEDAWTRTRDEVTALKRTVDDALHQMRQGIEEVLNAQRLSMLAATKAETAAAVFDKLKASQPDLHRMVREQDKVVAGVRDKITHLEEQVGGYAKRLDEFDAVAVDYEDTKGAVRGLDIVVKDLHSSERQRRQVGGRTS